MQASPYAPAAGQSRNARCAAPGAMQTSPDASAAGQSRNARCAAPGGNAHKPRCASSGPKQERPVRRAGSHAHQPRCASSGPKQERPVRRAGRQCTQAPMRQQRAKAGKERSMGLLSPRRRFAAVAFPVLVAGVLATALSVPGVAVDAVQSRVHRVDTVRPAAAPATPYASSDAMTAAQVAAAAETATYLDA